MFETNPKPQKLPKSNLLQKVGNTESREMLEVRSIQTNPEIGNKKSYKTKVIHYRKSGKVEIKKLRVKL